MEPWITTLGAILVSVLASQGFWLWIQKRSDSKSATTKLIRGLARKEIITSGLRYIDRGWLSQEEYDEYGKYYHEPYFELGGNGLAEKIVREVERLPIRKGSPTTGEIKEVSI